MTSRIMIQDARGPCWACGAHGPDATVLALSAGSGMVGPVACLCVGCLEAYAGLARLWVGKNPYVPPARPPGDECQHCGQVIGPYTPTHACPGFRTRVEGGDHGGHG